MPSFGMFQVAGLGRSHQRVGQRKRASFLVECFRLKLPIAFFRLLYIHCLDNEALICVFLCGFLASCFFHWNIYIPCVCFTYFYLWMHHHVCSESAHFLRFCVSFQSFITCLVRWGRCEYLNHATAQQSWGISCSKHWMSWWQAGPRLSLGVGLFLHKRSKKGCTLDGVEDVTPQRKRSWLTVVVGCTCLLHGIQENCNFCNSSGHCSSFVNRHQRHQDSSSSLSIHGVVFSRKPLTNPEFLLERQLQCCLWFFSSNLFV